MAETDSSSPNPERERRILDAAARLILRYGYDKTTIADIAREAGVSKGAVYLHWNSKDELFNALIWRETWVMVDEWLALMDTDPDGGTFGSMYKNGLLALQRSPFLARIFAFDQHLIGNHVLKHNPELIVEKYMANRKLLEKLREVGAVRQDINIETVDFILNMTMYGFLRIGDLIPPEQHPPLESIIPELGKLLDRALMPEDGGNQEAGKQIIRAIIEQFRQQAELVRNTASQD